MEITESTKTETAFSSSLSFESAQRMAIALCSSTMVPASYRGKENLGNVLVALEMAQRIGASPMAVMQNLYVIHGKPSWSSSFIIAAINQCGRFKPLRFKMTGSGESRSCVAYTEDYDGNEYESPEISMSMARSEGWSTKSGSKWKTMPDLMLRYRAAAFFGRLYSPEILMGMYTEYEQQDIHESNTRKSKAVESSVDIVMESLNENTEEK